MSAVPPLPAGSGAVCPLAGPATARLWAGSGAVGLRSVARVAPALLAVLLAVGCGGPSGRSAETVPVGTLPAASSGPSSGTPTAVAPSAGTATGTTEMTGIDLLFLSMLAGHTEQTLEIVRLVRDRLTDAELRTLVAAVEVTESDELAISRGWLAQAGRSPRADDHAGHGTGPDQLARLRGAPQAEVDAVLIEVLSAHQRAAADLARAHLAAGTDERVRDLARRVEQSRTAQVALMAARPAARD